MTIISKLKTARVVLITAITALIAACASLVPLQYRIPKTEIESKIARQLAAPKTFLSVFETRFNKPTLDLLDQEQRIRITLPMAITERLTLKTADAVAIVSARLQPVEEGRVVTLQDVRIESFRSESLQAVSQLLQRALVVFLEPALDKLAIYRMNDKDAEKFRIDRLEVVSDGLVLGTRPNK